MFLGIGAGSFFRAAPQITAKSLQNDPETQVITNTQVSGAE